MRNPWFHFQQFSLRQDLAAMKVCTDACVFGAWTAKRLGNSSRLLDIGTGTGLLTLMMAQAMSSNQQAELEAIEIDDAAVTQAEGNFRESPWDSRITLHRGDAADYPFAAPFDFIIVNPPFYEGQLQSPDPAANKARHENSLTLETLIAALKRTLKPAGRFAILLPASREEFFLRLAIAAGFSLTDICRLKQTPKHLPFRSLMLFSLPDSDEAAAGKGYRSGLTETPVISTEITIRDNAGMETQQLLAEMKDFYIRQANHSPSDNYNGG